MGNPIRAECRNPTQGQYLVIPLLVLRFVSPKFLAPRSDKEPEKKCDKAVWPHIGEITKLARRARLRSSCDVGGFVQS